MTHTQVMMTGNMFSTQHIYYMYLQYYTYIHISISIDHTLIVLQFHTQQFIIYKIVCTILYFSFLLITKIFNKHSSETSYMLSSYWSFIIPPTNQVYSSLRCLNILFHQLGILFPTNITIPWFLASFRSCSNITLQKSLPGEPHLTINTCILLILTVFFIVTSNPT